MREKVCLKNCTRSECSSGSTGGACLPFRPCGGSSQDYLFN